MFVAVVVPDFYTEDSNRDTGGFEAFLGETKEAAANKALHKAAEWSHFSESRVSYINYQVVVGELTEEAKRPVDFKAIDSL